MLKRIFLLFFLCSYLISLKANVVVLQKNLAHLDKVLNALGKELKREEEKLTQARAAEKQRRLEEQMRLEREERQRKERERIERERAEEERILQERRAQEERERRAALQREQERKEQERLAQERVAEEQRRLEEERKERARQAEEQRRRLEEQKRLERERKEQEIIARERAKEEKRKEEERIRQEIRAQEEREYLAALQKARERREQERLAQEEQRKRLAEQQKPVLSRITVPYDSKGAWVEPFLNQLHVASDTPSIHFGGYIFLNTNVIKGSRKRPEIPTEYTLKSYYSQKEQHRYKSLPKQEKRAKKEELKEIKEDLVGLYKIHVMPKDAHDFMIILEQIFEALKADPELQNAINTIKVLDRFDFKSNPQQLKDELIKQYGVDKVPPIIVIATSLGREQAQYVLDKLYELFKNMPGLDLTPRFNKKVTSLIYYAQGNSDEKLGRPEYFTDDKMFYRPDFVSKKHPEDYHLKDPSKNNSH